MQLSPSVISLVTRISPVKVRHDFSKDFLPLTILWNGIEESRQKENQTESYPNKTHPELQYNILPLKIVPFQVSCQKFESTSIFQLSASDALWENIYFSDCAEKIVRKIVIWPFGYLHCCCVFLLLETSWLWIWQQIPGFCQ